jgi:hypothetical protein
MGRLMRAVALMFGAPFLHFAVALMTGGEAN